MKKFCNNKNENMEITINTSFSLSLTLSCSDQDQERAIEADRYLQEEKAAKEDEDVFRQRLDSNKNLQMRTASITEIRTQAFDKLQTELLKMKEVG